MAYYRRLPRFDYSAPASIEEVLSLLGRYEGGARLMAGGTVVLHQMKDRIGVLPHLIGLRNIARLKTFSFDDAAGLTLGAMTLHQDIVDSPVVTNHYPLLATVCGRLATPQIRNMGTIGGNVAMRFSTAEALPALIALKAEGLLAGPGGERIVPVEELYREMKGGDVLVEFRIPPLPKGTKTGYNKFAVRERFDYATVAAAVVARPEGNTLRDISIALGGVTLPTMRAKAAEDILRGQAASEALIKETSRIAAGAGRVRRDLMFSREYKKEILGVVVERAIREALNMEVSV